MVQLIDTAWINTVAFETKRRKPLETPIMQVVQGAAILFVAKISN